MLNSTGTSSVRVLPNNKVYRQLFEAQVQLSGAYKRVRENQLTQSLDITTRPNGVPLIKNIRPHESQKRQLLTSKSFSYSSKTDPITLLFHEEQKRRENEQKQELVELKREVFNLPDDIEYIETDNKKDSITERLATNRQSKFTNFWNELLNQIAETNQNLVAKLADVTRKCNHYYENGDREIDSVLKNLLYQKEITSLTINVFQQAFKQLDQILPLRLATIQQYCQSIEELEFERIQKIRKLLKSYSDRLYKTHHLSEEETALQLEKQANELNKQILENRRIYAELEARLLAGETVRIHRYQGEVNKYQEKWRETTCNVHKQKWISNISEFETNFESKIENSCESLGSNIGSLTQSFLSHINTLNSFVQPISTRILVQNWYMQGQDIIKQIVDKREQLIQTIQMLINKEIIQLQNQSEKIRQDILTNQIYTKDQIQSIIERDIQPYLDERKKFLQETLLNRIQTSYEQLTNKMFEILDRLLAFIQPASEQWDEHQSCLDHVNVQLNDMMRECRRPHDIQNEKKLAKLDSTLDDLRNASNEKALTRLLNSSYDQLDALKSSYTQFYDSEHNLVNKYSNMINDEVNRYRTEMLDYFHAKQVDKTEPSSSSSSSNQYYTTSSNGITYELEGYTNMDSNFAQQISIDERNVSPEIKSISDEQSNVKSDLFDQEQSQVQTFLTEEQISSREHVSIPFSDAFRIPSSLGNIIMFNLCRNFLDYFDRWKDESAKRADAIMFSKHEELNKELDFQMHLHEPRRIRIEIDIHNVRAAELVMHEERIERHIRGVQETLEQTDADYSRMLTQFNKSLITYKDEIYNLEQFFVNATTSGRLLALENRLTNRRDQFMGNIRTSLRKFREHFDGLMQYLRQANMKFRKSFKTFSEGGNFSREEIEVYRKKLEKTAFQIDQAETMIIKELEKLEKKQLDEAEKIITQFRERFKNHLTDLEFIELANRWISEAQVKIKSEVALDNQYAHELKTLVQLFANQIDSVLNPNIDKQTSTLSEVRELFHQIIVMTYERALYLKCLNNELSIPSSIVPILKSKGLIIQEESACDLHVNDNNNSSQHQARKSPGFASNSDEMKSVRFASSSSPTTTSSRHRNPSVPLLNLIEEQHEDQTTILTIRTLLHKHEHSKNDELIEKIDANSDPKARALISSSSSRSKKSKQNKRKTADSDKDSIPSEKDAPSGQQIRPGHSRSRDTIYTLYCTFGEKKHPGQDFLSKILNILRDSVEGLLSHSEIYYKEKGARPVTRPQALREKFDEFAEMMIEKLKNYEQQCRTYHDQCVNEFRTVLEVFEQTASLIPTIEFNHEIVQAENHLYEYLREFHLNLNEKFIQSSVVKDNNFQLLRPTFANPTRKSQLQKIDQQEKIRQDDIELIINRLRSNTIEDVQTNAKIAIQTMATNSEKLLILFDEILTSDEITRMKIPLVRQSLLELIRRQQAGKPLDDAAPTPIIERKPGHWSGLTLFESRSSSLSSNKRSSSSSQKQKRSASVDTQKTTLPQIETIKQRDQAYQRYKENLNRVLADIEDNCSTILTDIDRYRTYWNQSIDTLQNLRTN